MKCFIISLVVATSLLFITGCDDTSTGPVAKSPITVEIGLNESVAIPEYGISLTMWYVNDARCPADGYCDWPGMAEVLVILKKSAIDSSWIELPMYGAAVTADTSDWMPIDKRGVRMILTSLSPYPPVADSSEYRATIRISPEQTPNSITGSVQLTNQTPSQIVMDDLWLRSVSVSNNLLEIKGQYGGGCALHFFWAFMTPDSLQTTGVPQIDVYIRHFTFGDGCNAMPPFRMLLDLSDVIDQYQSQFNRLDPIAIHVHEDETDAEVQTAVWYPPDWQPGSLFPMWMGTQWIYVDTNRTVKPMVVTYDTVEVTGSYTDSLGTWWTLSHPFPTTTDSVLLRGDTLFDLARFINEPWVLQPEYIPAADTPLTYDVIVDLWFSESRTATRVDTMIVSPIDSFVGAYEYMTDLTDQVKRHYIVPHIGLIYYDIVQSYPYIPGAARRIVLTELHLTR